MPTIGKLHVVTDQFEIAAAALKAGAPVVQVRSKNLSDRDLYRLVCRIGAAAESSAATVLVNDRADIAVAAGAHGVHVGSEDLPVAALRRALGPDLIIGGTARDPATARALAAEGATYLGVGPAYVSTSKEGLPAPLGLNAIGAVARAVSIPVIAIGGIRPAHVERLVAAGAYGVAAIAGIAAAADPFVATKSYLAALHQFSSS